MTTNVYGSRTSKVEYIFVRFRPNKGWPVLIICIVRLFIQSDSPRIITPVIYSIGATFIHLFFSF